MKKRFFALFICVFVLSFGILNSRFILATLNYYFNKADIQNANPSAKLFPIAEATGVKKPLSNNATLVIDSINITAPIVFGSGESEDAIYKGLESGVVHHSSTPKPGLQGISVILGHSSAFPWYRGEYGSVFALLNKLNPGDKIFVQYSDGRTFTFEIKKSLVFSPLGANSELKELESSNKPTIILLSCWPVGTNYRRIAIQAEAI